MEQKNHSHGEKCNIYGVDMCSNHITPKQVRDAIINCFINAHGGVIKEFKSYENLSKEELEKSERNEIQTLVKNFFGEVGGDFENPTKENLIRVMDRLADFSKKFREEEVINKHYQEIKLLIDKLQ